MSYDFNAQVFLGYELGKEIKDLVTSGKVSDEYLEDILENDDIDCITETFYGEFLYVGRSLSHEDENVRPGATELPVLTAADYMELKEKLCKEPLFKDLIGDKMPKLYHVYYYN
jgi:hypothetical protein